MLLLLLSHHIDHMCGHICRAVQAVGPDSFGQPGDPQTVHPYFLVYNHPSWESVCKHLSHEASHREDIAELIRTCQSAAERHGVDDSSNTLPSHEATSNNALTSRQTEILQLFARGLSYQEVGDQLNVTAKTIKNHASAIYERLGVKNKTEAVFEARLIGLLI